MVYIVGLIISVLWASLGFAAQQTRLDRRYDQICFLMTHNGYSSEQEGFIYANQYYDLKGQMERGVRAFELDIYHRCWEKSLGLFGSSGCTVSLCHGSCEITRWIKPSIRGILEKSGEPQSLVSALKTVKDFLTKNPQEVITIFLENYVSDPKELDKQFEDAGIHTMILKPTDWNPLAKNGWPDLKWMVFVNKRVVVFNDSSAEDMGYHTSLPVQSTGYTYFRWGSTVENQWGQLDFDKAAHERGASAAQNLVRYLYVLDYFPEGGKILGGGISDLIRKGGAFFKKETPFGGDYEHVNGPQLEQFLKRVVAQGLNGKYKGRYPNFIQLDYFQQGNPLALINKINDLANDPKKREEMFRPLSKEVKK